MTATPPHNRIWHPSRGISFSPGPSSPGSPGRGAHVVKRAASRPMPSQSIAFSSVDVDAAAPQPKDKEPSPAPPETAAPSAPGVGLEDASKVENDAIATDAASDTSKEEQPKEGAPNHPPFAALDFQIVPDLFYAAKKAPAGSPESFWSYTQYRGIDEDGKEQKVKVHYCRSKHTMEKVCQQYFMNEKLLGFDLEWATDSTKWQGLRKNVSLIQLASPSRIGLFHVALFSDNDDMVGPSFRAIMEDPGITKVGVAIKGDATRLRNNLDIDSKGLMELSHMYKLVTYSSKGRYQDINKRLVTLAAQVEQYLHLPLFKGQDVRSSDWTKPLQMDQVIYAASDAYAGVHLYATLEHHRKQLNPCPPIPYHAELNLPIRIADGIELLTNDEPTEEPTNTTYPAIPSSTFVSSLLESIRIEDLDCTETQDEKAAKPTTKSPSSKPRSKLKSPPGPKDSRVEAAEDRARVYRTSHPKARATFVQLRAYYLWHSHNLRPDIIARLLRDPPLMTGTVVSYIRDAIQAEKLAVVDRDRLWEDLAREVPGTTLRARWPFIAGMVGDRGAGGGSG